MEENNEKRSGDGGGGKRKSSGYKRSARRLRAITKLISRDGKGEMNG
jgi:hypothetical protein